jgi:hypothetical protein
MRWIGVIFGIALVLLMLSECFETILQPRRVMHRFRFARLFYRLSWIAWGSAARWFSPGRRRSAYLASFGPLSLLTLFALWVIGLNIGFALVHWSLRTAMHAHGEPMTFFNYLYFSGTSFFTVGYGDFTPVSSAGRALAVIEAGLGFAFLAVIISYLPVLYQAFSRRELMISLLDARAGSPPSATQLIVRLARAAELDSIDEFLKQCEQWAAELLESHLSFPVLSYYRSQHDNQSWLAALTTMLDTCSLLMTSCREQPSYQAQITFAIARHAAVDLCLVMNVEPVEPAPRLSASDWQRLREQFDPIGLSCDGATESRLAELRGMYEPFVNGLARRLQFIVPPIVPAELVVVDNWQRSAWMERAPGIGNLPVGKRDDDHF